MAVLQVIMLILIAITGAAVVFTRNTTKQAIVSGFYGLLLSLLFMVLHAPDVSLAAIVVGAIGLPMMILLALARIRGSI